MEELQAVQPLSQSNMVRSNVCVCIRICIYEYICLQPLSPPLFFPLVIFILYYISIPHLHLCHTIPHFYSLPLFRTK